MAEQDELNPVDLGGDGEDNPGTDKSRNPDNPYRRKVRVRVKKRIRIKKKPSSKKRLRKIGERALWTLIVIGFILSLIIMVVELDIRDERYKQKRKTSTTRSH